MNTSSFLGLLQNAALLLAVAFIFDLFANRWRTGQLLFRQAPVGLAIGAIGITIMMTPWIFAPGIVFDARSVLIGITGLFFGSITTVIAMAMTAAFRYYQGGTGAWTGIAVIIISGVIGIAWRHLRRRRLSDISWRELYLFGMVVHLAMLTTMLTLPWEIALRVLSNIALPVILICPAGTALLGVLMVKRVNRERSDDALRESEEKYRSLVENINDVIYTLDSVGRFTYVSPVIEKVSSYKTGDLIGKNFAGFVYPDDLPGLIESFNRTVQGDLQPFEYRIMDGDKVRYARSSSRLIFKDGVFAGLTGIMTDVSERKQAEDRLRKSEQQMADIIDFLPDATLAINKERRVIIWNKAIEEMTSVPAAEMIGKGDYAYTIPFYGEARPQLMDLIFDDQNEIKAKYPKITHEGDTLLIEVFCHALYKNKGAWVLAKASPLHDQSGNIIGAIESIRDITDRKQAEEKLRENKELEELILTSVPHGLFGVENREIFFANDAIKNVSGWEPEELIGKSTRILFRNDQEWEKYGAMLYSMLKNKSVISFDPPMPFIRKDGSEIYCRTSASRIGGDLTAGNRIVAMIEDITERKRSEEKLQKSEERFRLIFDTSPVGIGIATLDGQVLAANSATIKMMGYGLEEIKTINVRETYVHPDDRNLILKIVQETGGVSDYEVELKRKDGSSYWALLNMDKMRLDNQDIFLSTHRDITSRKQAEDEKRDLQERLNRAEKMEALGTLAGGVAHDLNNVLGIIVGYSEMILDEVDETSPLKRPVVNIFNSGQKAAAIVDDLLTLARRGVPGSNILNLNNIIKDSQQSPELAKLLSHHPSVKIKIDLDSDLLNISGSSVHLNKSLYNLISNACEAMNKGGILTIKTTNQYLDKPMSGYNEIREGDYVVLSVSDTGEGISEKDMKRIFEPFYTKKIMGRSGTGLGLAVVWGTVTDHNGYINVHSEEGQGSTFTLYFPVTREEIPTEASAINVSAYLGNGQSILIVDDVSIQRELATDMLKKLKYNVDSVKSGEEAIIYLKDHQTDLIILDMIMDPGMDGLDTYKSILQINPKQKTIIVSGFSESDRVKEAKRLGAGTYVRKPYIKEKLGLAVKKELG